MRSLLVRGRLRCAALLLLLLVLGACGPSTQYNRGVFVSYHPTTTAPEQARLVGSAMAYTETDLDAIKAAGGVYLGELEITAEKNTELTGGSAGATFLQGRASIGAAEHGATHFLLVASDIEHSVKQARDSEIIMSRGRTTHVQAETLKARYALWRVEAPHWSELSPNLRPTTPVAGATSAPATPATVTTTAAK